MYFAIDEESDVPVLFAAKSAVYIPSCNSSSISGNSSLNSTVFMTKSTTWVIFIVSLIVTVIPRFISSSIDPISNSIVITLSFSVVFTSASLPFTLAVKFPIIPVLLSILSTNFFFPSSTFNVESIIYFFNVDSTKVPSVDVPSL